MGFLCCSARYIGIRMRQNLFLLTICMILMVSCDDVDRTPSVPHRTVVTGTSGNGTILLDPDQGGYEENTLITVTAIPADGWLFTGWRGDLVGISNPIGLIVDGDKNITATFVKDLPLTLTVKTVGNGATVTMPSRVTYSYGEAVAITATADSGWQFDHWESDPPINGRWWDRRWSYRLPITVNGAGYARTDAPAEIDLNFTEVWHSIGVSGELDLDSLRVIEVNDRDNILDKDVPFQFDPGDAYDAGTNSAGTLTILLSGNTTADNSRFYHLYFDDIDKSLPAAFVSPLVIVTDNVRDEWLTTYRIDTREATYYYDKRGGGFSRIVDRDGYDWISYNRRSGAGGEYRGIPNLVYPEGYMHPGKYNVVSAVVHQGPLKITLRSTSSDGKWETLWEIYPDFARLTVLSIDHAYWFLYEGTPGGVLDVTSDVVIRAEGQRTLAGESWTGDLVGEEWVYFGDPVVGRSLYIANHQKDTAVDSYYAMDDKMTVFGFGRKRTDAYLNAVPATFTLGLVDDTSYETVAGEVQAAFETLGTTIGVAEVQDSNGRLAGDGVKEPSKLAFNITADQEVTATFVELVSPP